MQIGSIKLYRYITIFESTGNCPYPKFLLGEGVPERKMIFHWLDDELNRNTEGAEPTAIAVVEMPDWMTAMEGRAWVQSQPERLEPFFDAEWYRHADLLDQHFGRTDWFEARDHLPMK